MIPTREEAEKELEIAAELSPGPWIEHSKNVGLAAQKIADGCPDLDSEKAYIFGILHDIGKRVGYVSIPVHVYEGYKFCMEKGWYEAAKICMTHSYPIKDKDFTDKAENEEKFIKDYLSSCVYDNYDKLIILCDSLAVADGFCLLEKRFIDVARRYGVWDTSVPRWNATFEIKEYFENIIGCSIYNKLPNVKETTFMDAPLWKPPIS